MKPTSLALLSAFALSDWEFLGVRSVGLNFSTQLNLRHAPNFIPHQPPHDNTSRSTSGRHAAPTRWPARRGPSMTTAETPILGPQNLMMHQLPPSKALLDELLHHSSAPKQTHISATSTPQKWTLLSWGTMIRNSARCKSVSNPPPTSVDQDAQIAGWQSRLQPAGSRHAAHQDAPEDGFRAKN